MNNAVFDEKMINTTKSLSERHAFVNHYRLPVRGVNPAIHLYLCEENDASLRPKTGLLPSSSCQAYYLGPQEQKPLSLELVPGPVDNGSCGFWEIDQQLMPGLYGLQVPSYLRSLGYTYVYLHFPGTRPHYLGLQGLGYDPYDTFAIGLTNWALYSCHDHLTTGLRKSMPSVLRPLLATWLNSK
jgi:hypothetical protein